MKPYEVELLVAQVGYGDDDNAEMYHVMYDGVVMDEQSYSVLGGSGGRDHRGHQGAVPTPVSTSTAAVKLGAKVLGTDDTPLTVDQLEVALLDRSRPRRAFRRFKNGRARRNPRVTLVARTCG